MNKLLINGVHYLWKSISYESPGGDGYSVLVAFPVNNPGVEPLFLVDNNGHNPFSGFSYAVWFPAMGISTARTKPNESATWESATEKKTYRRDIATDKLKTILAPVFDNSGLHLDKLMDADWDEIKSLIDAL